MLADTECMSHLLLREASPFAGRQDREGYRHVQVRNDLVIVTTAANAARWDLVAVLDGRRAAGEPATFYDGLAVQRVMEAVRDGRGARLD